LFLFFFSSRRRHTRCLSDWSSDVCSSDLSSRLIVCRHQQRRRRGPQTINRELPRRGDPHPARGGQRNRYIQSVSLLRRLRAAARSEERRVGKEVKRQGGSSWMMKERMREK